MWWTAAAALAATLPGIDAPLRTGASAPGDSAVVIGIETYPFVPSADVGGAAGDAQVVHDLLFYTRGIPADRIQLLGKTAARESVLEAVRAAGAETSPGDTVWVYFAGLAASDPVEKTKLWLGVDVQPLASSFVARGVPVDEVERLAGAGGAQVVLMVDAAYDATDRSGAALLDKRLMVPSYAPRGGQRVVWMATDGSAPVARLDQHGAFTQLAVGAMRGWADGELDGERDGVVRFDEARAYVARMLRAHGAGQVALATGPDAFVLSRATERGPGAPEVVTPSPPEVVRPPPVAPPAEIGSYEALRVEPGKLVWRSLNNQKFVLPEPFLIGTTEVTQGLYELLMGENPVRERRQRWRDRFGADAPYIERGPCRLAGVGPTLPVTCVDAWDVARFANALSVHDGLDAVYTIPASGYISANPAANGWRLPLDVEWLWAAVGKDTKRAYASAQNEVELCKFANFADQSPSKEQFELMDFDWGRHACTDGAAVLAPVGSYLPNRLGLYDMSGNAEEWVETTSKPWRGTEVDPQPSGGGNDAMGSSFLDANRSANLGHNTSVTGNKDRRLGVGFRLVRNLRATPYNYKGSGDTGA